jgi:hypothetical protein
MTTYPSGSPGPYSGKREAERIAEYERIERARQQKEQADKSRTLFGTVLTWWEKQKRS